MKDAANNITDAEIRALYSDLDRHVQVLARIALNDAVTYKRASVVRDARKRLAKIIHARSAP